MAISPPKELTAIVSRSPIVVPKDSLRPAPRAGSCPRRSTGPVALTRPRSGSGVTAWRRLSAFTLMIITAGSLDQPDATRNGIGIAAGATATRSVAMMKRSRRIKARPMPSRSPIVWASAPTIVPIPPIATVNPMAAGDSPSSRTTKTR